MCTVCCAHHPAPCHPRRGDGDVWYPMGGWWWWWWGGPFVRPRRGERPAFAPQPLPSLFSPFSHPGCGETGRGGAMLRPPPPPPSMPARCCVGASTQLSGKLVTACARPREWPRHRPRELRPFAGVSGGAGGGVASSQLALKDGDGKGSLCSAGPGRGWVKGIQPFPRAGSVPGTPKLAQGLPAPASWGAGGRCFSVPPVAPWLSPHCWCGGCWAGSPPSNGKPSPGVRGSAPTEAARSYGVSPAPVVGSSLILMRNTFPMC